MNKDLKRYAELTEQIRELAAPVLSGVKGPEEYYEKLKESFTRIKELAEENERILQEHFYPLMDPERELTEEDIQLIRDFSAFLIKPESMESLDLPMFYFQSDKLLEDALRKEDLRLELQALDNMVMAAYAMLMVTLRLYPSFDVFIKYRDSGYTAAEKILKYLEPNGFAGLPDHQCRETVLINSRYISAFFEWADKEDFVQRVDKDIQMLKDSLALCEDGFYLENAPDYDWKYHKFRTLEYLTNLQEFRDYARFEKRQLETVSKYTRDMAVFLEENPKFKELCPDEVSWFYIARSGYQAGELSTEEYKKRLLQLYETRRMKDFSSEWVHLNLMIPYEYLEVTQGKELNAEDEEFLRTFYSELVKYVYELPFMGVMTFMISCLSEILRNYIEIPEAPDMGDMILDLMAATHPPTFVHSHSVADFTVYLTGIIMERHPEKFTGILGTETEEQVVDRREEIMDFVHKAALLHDTGKLFIIETIITYGRKLFISEFDMIKAHPDAGADLLESKESTRPFAFAARGHHIWHRGAAGYPKDYCPGEPWQKAVLDVLTVADCLDASTDSLGRNYKRGKTLDEFIAELQEGFGTRYAPYVVELFRDEAIRKEIEDKLEKVRTKNYGKAYAMLSEH